MARLLAKTVRDKGVGESLGMRDSEEQEKRTASVFTNIFGRAALRGAGTLSKAFGVTYF